MNKELKTWKEVVQALLDGEQVELFSEVSGVWKDVLYFPNFRSTELRDTPDKEYRIKPRTILIGGVEVPEPVKDVSEFEEGEVYYFTSPTNKILYDFYPWGGDDVDIRLLKSGMIHKTKESAILHAKALIKISGGSYE